MSHSMIRDGAWGAAARDWAAVQEGTLHPLFARVLTQTGVGPGQAVLDVGCGTGLFCVLARACGASVAGLDASAGQLMVARERLPGADLREGAMEALPFADSHFDLVTCCNALQYATDTVVALREMRRVARPGGTVGILTGAPNGPKASQAYFQALEPLRPPPAPDGPPMTLFRRPEALEAALVAAELPVYAAAELDCDWAYPDLDTALRGALSFAPAVRAIRHSGAEVVRAAVSDALTPYRTSSGGYHLPNRMRYILARVG